MKQFLVVRQYGRGELLSILCPFQYHAESAVAAIAGEIQPKGLQVVRAYGVWQRNSVDRPIRIYMLVIGGECWLLIIEHDLERVMRCTSTAPDTRTEQKPRSRSILSIDLLDRNRRELHFAATLALNRDVQPDVVGNDRIVVTEFGFCFLKRINLIDRTVQVSACAGGVPVVIDGRRDLAYNGRVRRLWIRTGTLHVSSRWKENGAHQSGARNR